MKKQNQHSTLELWKEMDKVEKATLRGGFRIGHTMLDPQF